MGTNDAAATNASDNPTLPDAAGREAERVRVRRRRRRTTIAERNAFRFRAALLIIVLCLIIATLMGDRFGRGAHQLLESLRSSSLFRVLRANIRWETVILSVIAAALLVMMIPGAEDRLLRFLRLRKK